MLLLAVLYTLSGTQHVLLKLLHRTRGLLGGLLARWAGKGDWKRISFLRKRLKVVDEFREWLAAAKELDTLEGRSQWRDQPSDVFDQARIETALQSLRELVEMEDLDGIMQYLRSQLNRNLGGIGHRRLYSYMLSGTKRIIEEYFVEVIKAIRLVANAKKVNNFRKLAFFNETRHSFGRSALLLSGGSTFGLYHAGVIKALIENGMLPRVISGSSVGSIFAAILGARKDSELRFDAEAFEFSFFPSEKGSFGRKIRRLFTRGVVLDIEVVRDCIRSNIGDITFAESYARTGRVVNIVVAPVKHKQEKPRLLNYLTAPNTLLWSAAVASCAIPGVFEPVELLMKDAHGNIVPYYSDHVVYWQDGSFFMDLPMYRLSELFNVNHFIVSQVNPFVVPFVYHLTSSNSLLHLMIDLIGCELRDLVSHTYSAFEFLIPFASIWRNVVAQQYHGDITIYPHVKWWEFFLLFTNPTSDRLDECVTKAQNYTFSCIQRLFSL